MLDEPSIGLHPRDNDRLLDTLGRLRDLGNTVLVVEHDAETIERADYVIDLGPGAGRLGGALVAAERRARSRRTPPRSPANIWRATVRIELPAGRRHGNGKKLIVSGAREHNLKNIDGRIPAGHVHRGHRRFGQRKIDAGQRYSLPSLAREIYGSHDEPGAHDSIDRARAHRQSD